MPMISVVTADSTKTIKIKSDKSLIDNLAGRIYIPDLFQERTNGEKHNQNVQQCQAYSKRALTKVPALAIAMTTANKHQAVTSSLAAEAIDKIPICFFVNPLS